MQLLVFLLTSSFIGMAQETIAFLQVEKSRKYKNDKIGFTITYPSGLTVSEDKNVVIIGEKKSPYGYIAAISNNAFGGFNNNAAQYFDILLKANLGSIKERVPSNGPLDKKENLVIDGFPAVRVNSEFMTLTTPTEPVTKEGLPVEGAPTKYYRAVIFINKNGTIWSIENLSPDPITFENNVKIFEQISSTFKFENK